MLPWLWPLVYVSHINTLRPRQNGRHFADDTFKRIFMNGNVRISINISLKFVPKGLINNVPALVYIMAWRRLDGKPLSEPMMVISLAHICVTRPQWVNRTSSAWCLNCKIRSYFVWKIDFSGQSALHGEQAWCRRRSMNSNWCTGINTLQELLVSSLACCSYSGLNPLCNAKKRLFLIAISHYHVSTSQWCASQ